MNLIKRKLELKILRATRLGHFSRLELFSCSGTYKGYVAMIRFSPTLWLNTEWWFTDLSVAVHVYEEWAVAGVRPKSLPKNPAYATKTGWFPVKW